MRDTNADDVIDAVEQIAGWTVDDYQYTDGMYEDPTLTLELAADEAVVKTDTDADASDRAAVIETIRDLEQTHDSGAPVDTVRHRVVDETDLTHDQAAAEIESLKRRGEVYEPARDYLRLT